MGHRVDPRPKRELPTSHRSWCLASGWIPASRNGTAEILPTHLSSYSRRESNIRKSNTRETLQNKPFSYRDGIDEVPRERRAREQKGRISRHHTAAVPPWSSRSPSAPTSQTLSPQRQTTQARRGYPSGLALRREPPSPGTLVEAEEHVSKLLSIGRSLFCRGFSMAGKTTWGLGALKLLIGGIRRIDPSRH
jgi:hypothetical protein